MISNLLLLQLQSAANLFHSLIAIIKLDGIVANLCIAHLHLNGQEAICLVLYSGILTQDISNQLTTVTLNKDGNHVREQRLQRHSAANIHNGQNVLALCQYALNVVS